eukprot:gnl/TRDRNA2_/TRDRNA2_181049_c0_seq1.p1 gnl/TRDRNA2_/TRDRNA2_181049_c0~~gnl/TRDRNA2_/TRDRNA2_181049_c0_seq1.p1  ORF type:complete len:571 (+),score=111.94 gnl/TRDRNA2_/TRDRNA2_181049_c0_seq1:69-1715(+)
MAAQVDRSLHVCLLGNAALGQRQLLRSYGGDGDMQAGSNEDGAGDPLECLVTVVELDGEPHRVRLMDGSAIPCLDRVQVPLLNESHALLLCFDASNSETLRALEETWLPLVQAVGSTVPYFVAALSTGTRRSVSEEEGVSFAQRVHATDYIECSLWESESVQLLVERVLLLAREHYEDRWRQQTPNAGKQPREPPPAPSEEGYYLAEHMMIKDDTVPLTGDIITKNMSELGNVTARAHAYLRVDLAKLGLTSVDGISPFQCLQFVNISGNRLRSLEPLGNLRCLLHLNASLNLLIRTQCFAAPEQLETVDMSYNLIDDLGNWSSHMFLRELNLRGNFIQRLGPGLLHNKALRMLDLSENSILRIENMQELNLRTLLLAQNRVASLEGVGSLTKLQVLDVRHNEIATTAPLKAEDIPRLRKLCISENQIPHIREVEGLQGFTFLCDLFLAPNPILELPYYREQVLNRLPGLRWLDEEAVSAKEKVKADAIYGADVGKRNEIFSELLPQETFVDRRLVTMENIVAMEQQKFGQQGGFKTSSSGRIAQTSR